LDEIRERIDYIPGVFAWKSSLHDHRIVEFCEVWAYRTENAPLDDMVVDQYFHYEYKNWRGI
jgi:hypothetical protein